MQIQNPQPAAAARNTTTLTIIMDTRHIYRYVLLLLFAIALRLARYHHGVRSLATSALGALLVVPVASPRRKP